MKSDQPEARVSRGRRGPAATLALGLLLALAGAGLSCSKEPEKAPASTKGVDPRKAASSLDQFSGPDPRDAPATPAAKPQDKPSGPAAPPTP